MRIRLPRPSTFVWRSLVDVRLGGGFLDGSAEIWRLEEVDLEGFWFVSTEEIARDGKPALELEQEADSSSFFSSNWNGKLGR